MKPQHTRRRCGPCKAVAPRFEAMAKEYKGKAVFLKVDVDKCGDVSSQCGVKVIYHAMGSKRV